VTHKLLEGLCHLADVDYYHGIITRISFLCASSTPYRLEFIYKEAFYIFELCLSNVVRQMAFLKRPNKTKANKALPQFSIAHHMGSTSFVETKTTAKIFGFPHVVKTFALSCSSIHGINSAFFGFRLLQCFFKRVEFCPFNLKDINRHLPIVYQWGFRVSIMD